MNQTDAAAGIVEIFEGSVITPNDVVEYLGCIAEAVQVHADREFIRHGLWKEYDEGDQLRQVDIKAVRCRKIIERAIAENRTLTEQEQTEIRSECCDIINYAVFAMRCLRGA